MSKSPGVIDGAQELAERASAFLFARDEMTRSLGMRIMHVEPGRASVSMLVRTDMVNGHGSCHGGVLFSLADSAFAFACNSHNSVTVAAGATIDFLVPARQGDVLTAIARELWRSRRSGMYDVAITNQNLELVALFRGRSHQLDGKVVNS